MTGDVAAVWGGLGALGVESLEFVAVTRNSGRWPWLDPGGTERLPLAVCIVVRVAVGAIVAGALGAAAQVSGQFGALTAGIGGPMLIQQTARQVTASRESRAVRPPANPAGTGLDQSSQLTARPVSAEEASP
jgi:hypothetical protein